MMQIDRLRLVGFKSFVDATELTVSPGLTGIVGPNGCGKSNLVEALRWVMGETSAKRLRGGEMDDVIFAGSAERPARNLAEVALTLDNSARDAPFAFNDREEIEIVRRIERAGGSVYRVNGHEVRARDVQLLFADAASGAHSGAMVSQGRVSALIEAKPAERRLLLEEAAGTTGLHARRHETELRLKGAEDNLLRLDDVIATIEAQLQTLKKQARQAQRYRRLGEHIRRTEALLLHARWRAVEAEAERHDRELRAVQRAVAEASENALAGRRAREVAEAAVPPLRVAEAAAAADQQRLAHARTALEQELQRTLAARGEAERRFAELSADLEREGDLVAEAEATLQRVTESTAAVEARRAALQRHHLELVDRRSRLEVRHLEGERQRETFAAAVVPVEAVTAATAVLATAEQRVEECRAAVTAGEEEAARCRAVEQTAVET